MATFDRWGGSWDTSWATSWTRAEPVPSLLRTRTILTVNRTATTDANDRTVKPTRNRTRTILDGLLIIAD